MNRSVLVLSAGLALPAAEQDAPPSPPGPDAVARALADAFARGDAEKIHTLSAPVLQQHLPVASIASLCGRLRGAIGRSSGSRRSTRASAPGATSSRASGATCSSSSSSTAPGS